MPRALLLVLAAQLAACVCALPPEQGCNNGIDEDADGFLDCLDLDCQADAACLPDCGDGDLDPQEECDGALLGGASCASLGLGAGALSCNALCLFETSACLRLEQCEQPGDEDGDGLADCDDPECAASAGCQVACGDGRLSRGEGCDDGNLLSGDGCDDTCQAEFCGDGLLNNAPNESCDDGNLLSGDGCDDTCQIEAVFCGDGILQAGEGCDDGNQSPNDGCEPGCQTLCGDGFLVEGELCFVSSSHPTAFDPFSLALGDLTGDGALDLALAHNLNDQISFFSLASPQPDFFFARFLPEDSLPGGIALGDFDQDGDLDAAVSESNRARLRLLLNPGDGALTLGPELVVGVDPEVGLLALDLNGDGILDLAAANTDAQRSFDPDRVSILLGLGGGQFAAETGFTVGETPFGLAAFSRNGSPGPSLVTANLDGSSLSILAGDGQGGFTQAGELLCDGPCGGVAAADLDGDGDHDLVGSEILAGTLAIFFQQADGSFLAGPRLATGSAGPVGVLAVDLDGDGDHDVASANFFAADLSLFVNQGGSFLPARVVPTEPGPEALAAADLNGDGISDIVSANRGSASITLFLSVPF